MPVTYDFGVVDAKNEATETAIGANSIIRAYNGTMPANIRTALSGNTVLAQGTLPNPAFTASASGVKSKTGVWTMTGQSGAGAGTAGTFYRRFSSDGTTAREQGTFGVAGTDMTVDNNSIVSGQTITISTYQKTGGNL